MEAIAKMTDENPMTSQAIWDALPFTGKASLWGEEIYFQIPVDIGIENGRTDVEIGEIGYWPDGNAMCIFFGQTPMSEGEKPKAYSHVNIFAKLIGDASIFSAANEGENIEVERAE